MGFFSKISAGLKKTRDSIMGSVNSMLHAFTKIDEELFEELEEILIMGDVGAPTAGSATSCAARSRSGASPTRRRSAGCCMKRWPKCSGEGRSCG